MSLADESGHAFSATAPGAVVTAEPVGFAVSLIDDNTESLLALGVRFAFSAGSFAPIISAFQPVALGGAGGLRDDLRRGLLLLGQVKRRRDVDDRGFGARAGAEREAEEKNCCNWNSGRFHGLLPLTGRSVDRTTSA